ncbi:MAG: SusD/RagB family nutrient-binding outer membrane lipoprotein [Candidatus Pseudobacter hemicellulosilyticus]|uniref:SusD/RagB family nutrient-binding outer membrane lipoprotein n=1 Tax=Candidatus Pseudobacter hemicellulosilyticus TaxID=3121375 RepID=A0AAJ5WPG4_9BACT|nr:MAG: SusD/RagB family nutrient-binding outer membrane lipoprotein [Pseudobacter sp.]
MKLFLYILVAGILLAGQACTKGFDDLNTNPSGISDLDPSYQLTKIQADMSGDREDTWRYDLGICSPIVQQLGGSWWTQHGGMYQVVEKNHWFSHWETTFPRELKNIQDIIDKTADDPAQANMHAAARILRVYLYAKLTDLYGDIPYSEAIKGYTERKFLPKYDSQESIYQDFFKELEAAVATLDAAGPAIKGDLFFSGDISKWKKLGNSLRLRLGFRLTKVNSGEAQRQVEAAIAGGVMTQLEDICMLKHAAISFTIGDNRGNGRSQVFKSEPISAGFRLVRTFVDTMVNTQDPRLYIFGGTYIGDGIIGVSNNLIDLSGLMPALGTTPGAMAWNEWSDYGTVQDGAGNDIYVGHNNKFLQPSKYVSALDAPFFHITPAEVEFLLAEAAARGWGGLTDPEEHFMKGIQLACEATKYYPGAPAIAQERINDLKDAYTPFPTAFADRMNAIHTQVWVNFFLNGAEAYANFRRTGYPALTPFTSVEWYTSGTNGVIPRRFFYPESEAIQNPVNYQAAVDRLGGANDWLKRVWWDKE